MRTTHLTAGALKMPMIDVYAVAGTFAGQHQLAVDLAGKPKPTNTAPGLIYMLNGATQHSFTDPFDRTSPAIPIGPRWMLIWPFDAKAAGIGTIMRDGGTMVMFAGTPYAHLHICGSPWDGNEY